MSECPLECGTGWHELIYKMLVELDNWALSQDVELDIGIYHMKEKYGILNVYHRSCDEEVNVIIGKYCELSKSTCEICGAEGKLIKDGYWIRYRDWETDRKSTRLNSSHSGESRMPSSA